MRAVSGAAESRAWARKSEGARKRESGEEGWIVLCVGSERKERASCGMFTCQCSSSSDWSYLCVCVSEGGFPHAIPQVSCNDMLLQVIPFSNCLDTLSNVWSTVREHWVLKGLLLVFHHCNSSWHKPANHTASLDSDAALDRETPVERVRKIWWAEGKLKVTAGNSPTITWLYLPNCGLFVCLIHAFPIATNHYNAIIPHNQST